MINELITIANNLDAAGFNKEAELLDEVIRSNKLSKIAQQSELDKLRGEVEELKAKVDALADLRPLLPHINMFRNLIREGDARSAIDLQKEDLQERRDQRRANRAPQT